MDFPDARDRNDGALVREWSFLAESKESAGERERELQIEG